MNMRLIFRRRALALLLAALLLTAALSGCGETAGEPSESVPQTAVTAPAESAAPQETPAPEEPEDDGVTWITLADGEIKIDGKGAGVEQGLDKVTIKSGGVYHLTGTLTNGRVVIKANPDDAVELILDGVDITSQGNDAIFCKKAGTLRITLAEGTENSLTSGGPWGWNRDLDNADTGSQKGVKAEGNLTVSGGGSGGPGAGGPGAGGRHWGGDLPQKPEGGRLFQGASLYHRRGQPDGQGIYQERHPVQAGPAAGHGGYHPGEHRRRNQGKGSHHHRLRQL